VASPRLPAQPRASTASSEVSECFRDLAEASERPPYLKNRYALRASFAITPERSDVPKKDLPTHPQRD
jgi:hypothetical protein